MTTWKVVPVDDAGEPTAPATSETDDFDRALEDARKQESAVIVGSNDYKYDSY